MSPMQQSPIYLDEKQVFRHVPVRRAVDALQDALRKGLDPRTALPRERAPLGNGEMHMLPAEFGGFAGLKVLTLAPQNSERKLPVIQGHYLLFDATTLRPVAILDGPALTAIRTSAVSALGVRHLAADGASHLLVFGTGLQAYHHVHAVEAVRPLSQVTVVGRNADKAEALVARLKTDGFKSVAAGSASDVAEADIVVCCTASTTPLFDGSLVRDDAVVVAMGAHTPDAREVDDALIRRADVYVEAPSAAMTEAGDVIQAVAAGAVAEADLKDLRELVGDSPVRAGDRVVRTKPAVFKTVGMGWEDLVVARAAYQDHTIGGIYGDLRSSW